MPVRKAVLPAAGFGTRFLPASKSVPKEMLPVVDKPGIQYAVEEATRSGIEDIVIVTSRGKSSMEDHFDFTPDLEAHLEKSGKREELEVIRRIAELADVHFVRQKEQLGFGHAVAMARWHVGSEPFALLIPDEIVPEPAGSEESLLDNLIGIYDEQGASVVMVVEVPQEEISSYGAIAYEDASGKALRVIDMVEKPAVADAPSNLAARGRYILTPDVFDAIDKTEPGVGGEIQLTDALNSLAHGPGLFAFVHDGAIFDVGRPLSYLQATVELALRRTDLAKPFREFLEQVLSRET